MGYRNRVAGKVVSRDGETVTIAVGDSSMAGLLREPLEPGDAAPSSPCGRTI